MLNKQETKIIRKERDSKEQEYVKYITCKDDVEDYIYCYGGYYYPVPSIDNVISYVYPVDSIEVNGKVTYLSRKGSKYQRTVRTDEVSGLSVGDSVVITQLPSHIYKVIQIIRKEEKNMSDLELYTKDLELEAKSTKDILTANLREAARVLSLTPKDIKFKVEGNCKMFTLSVKFDYLNQTRYAQFRVIKKQRVWNITYRIYSYDDFLRERTIETSLVVELQKFMQLVLRQDLYLEIDSNIVE